MNKSITIGLLVGLLSACGSGSEEDSEFSCPPTPIAIDVNTVDLSINDGAYQANSLIVFNELTLDFETNGVPVYAKGNEYDPQQDYRTDCVTTPMIIGTNNSLTQFNIYSTADFNSALTAGTSLNQVFTVASIDTGDFQTYYQNGEAPTLAQLQDSLPFDAPRYFTLKLNQAPEFESSHIFYIEIGIDEQQILLETTELLISES